VTPEEFQKLYPHVIGWIRLTLAAHEKNAKLASVERMPVLVHNRI
jgi:hypothetical protein